MLRQFYAKSGDIYQIPWDHSSALDTITDVIARGVCLVGERSCAGALLLPFPYNRSVTVAHVVFWHFTRPRELRIFDTLAAACREAGCTHINPSSLWPNEVIGRYYQRRGLRQAETQWLGEIACIPHRKD